MGLYGHLMLAYEYVMACVEAMRLFVETVCDACGFAGKPGLEGKRPVRRSTSVGKPSAIRPEVVLLPWGSFH